MMLTSFCVIMADVFQMTGNVTLMMIVATAVTRRRNGDVVSCLTFGYGPYFEKRMLMLLLQLHIKSKCQ